MEEGLKLQQACLEFLDIAAQDSAQQLIRSVGEIIGYQGSYGMEGIQEQCCVLQYTPEEGHVLVRGLFTCTRNDPGSPGHMPSSPTRRKKGHLLSAESGPILGLEPSTLALGGRTLRTGRFHSVALDLLASASNEAKDVDE